MIAEYPANLRMALFPQGVPIMRSGNNRFGFLLICLLLLGTLAFSPVSYGDHDRLEAGRSDYSHYPQGGSLFVSVFFGSDGRLWRIVPEKQYVYVDYSTDLGKTFSAPVRVNNDALRVKASGENRPGIVVDGTGKIYATFAAEGAQPIEQVFSVSTDGGRSFSTPMPLSSMSSEANSFEGRLAIGPSGQPYAFWLDERDRTDWRQPGNAIYFRELGPGDGNHSVDRKLADTVCECCRIAVSFDHAGYPVVLARFVYPGDMRDLGLVQLGSDGRPFSSRATHDQWELKGCPEHGPALSIGSDNHYHIAWFTQGSARQGLFYAFSSDGGQRFSQPQPFGTPGRMPSHPDVLASGRNVFLTWVEFDAERSHLLFMRSGDGGETWSSPVQVAESRASSDFPFLLTGPRGVFISWNSKKEGYRLIPITPAASSSDR